MKPLLKKIVLFSAFVALLTACSKKEEVVTEAPLTIASATAQAIGTWKATQFSVVNNGVTNKFTPTKSEMLQITATNVKLYSSTGSNSLFDYKIGNDSGYIDAFDWLYSIEIPTAALKADVLGQKYKALLGTDNYFFLNVSNTDGFVTSINGTKLTLFIPFSQMTLQFEKQ
ncbi:hypothetical protein [Flavobacterium sp.]|uniref:hypothetical protein n=1 Tax=Flavobacterium sp. TaxID=239 RepID=UPI00261E8F56|nr:hypothetical protein [Flavobacterium sp.]